VEEMTKLEEEGGKGKERRERRGRGPRFSSEIYQQLSSIILI